MKKTVIFKEGSTFSLKADFYESGRDQAPVVIYIHGGGLIWGTRKELSEDMIELYTKNGFSIFSIDYRLAPETKLPEILTDIEDAVKWLQTEGPNHFSIHAEKIAVVGSSAGGYLALNTGTFISKPRAIISFYGYGDLIGTWATSPSKYYLDKDTISKDIAYRLIKDEAITEATVEEKFLFYVYARQKGAWIEEVTGINPVANKEALYRYCPNRNVTKDFPPTLLLHGTKDTDVPYEQSVFTRAALVKESVEAKLITIPNGEHVFDKDFHDPTVHNALQQVIEFLKSHLG